MQKTKLMNTNPSSSSAILSQILGERKTVAGLQQAGWRDKCSYGWRGRREPKQPSEMSHKMVNEKGLYLQANSFCSKTSRNCSGSQRERENCPFPHQTCWTDALGLLHSWATLLVKCPAGRSESLGHTLQILPATAILFLTCFGDCQTSSCGGMGLAWRDKQSCSLPLHSISHLTCRA